MSTYERKSVTVEWPTPGDYAKVERALTTAYNHLEDLVIKLAAIERNHHQGHDVQPMPTLETVGRVFDAWDGLELQANQFSQEARRLASVARYVNHMRLDADARRG